MSGSIDQLVALLRGAGEPTRLRLLAVLSYGELTVSELTQVLGHSQPRISRHLKLLVDAGLLERKPEGSWVFYRLANQEASSSPDANSSSEAGLARVLADLVPRDAAELQRDLERLDVVRQSRSRLAQSYFKENAARWDELRLMHAPDADVEAAVCELAGPGPHKRILDMGTGTGRMLALLAPYAKRAEGIDANHDMLTIARLNLDQPELSHCQVRHGDICALPYSNARKPGGVERLDEIDLITIHQVLHYVTDPQAVLNEAARVLAPGGRLLVIDFAPHQVESLRDSHAHRRLGFSDEEMQGYLSAAGLKFDQVRHLKPLGESANPKLTVSIWSAQSLDAPVSSLKLEQA